MYSVATCEAWALRLTATCSNKAFITSSLGWVAVAVRSLRSFTLLVAGEPVAAFEAATRSKLFVFLDMFYFRTCNHLQSTCTQPSPSQHLPSSPWQQHHFACHSSLLTSHLSHSLRATLRAWHIGGVTSGLALTLMCPVCLCAHADIISHVSNIKAHQRGKHGESSLIFLVHYVE